MSIICHKYILMTFFLYKEYVLSVITVGGTKGGVGKTTIATNLAVMRSAEGLDVLLIDGDDQESATDFASIRAEVKGSTGYTAIKLTGSAIRDQGLKLVDKYDDIIIDVGGRDTTSQRAALVISDIALVPFAPRSFDIWTQSKVERLIEECKTVNSKLKTLTFLNKADVSGNDNVEAAEALKESSVLTYLDFPIVLRKSFANASSDGCAVTERKPIDKKAIEEIQALYRHIFDV